MWINPCIVIFASVVAFSAATAHYGFADLSYSAPVLPYSSFGYVAPQYFAPTSYDYFSGHTPNRINPHHPSAHLDHLQKFRGFAYHNDFKGGSGSSNVIFLTGPGTSQIDGFPSFLYPGLESPSVEIARKKASNEVDSNAKVPVAGKKPVTKTKPVKDLCETFQDVFGKGGLHNFYSFDNGPLFVKPEYDFNTIPGIAAPSWPYGFENFGPIYPGLDAIIPNKLPGDDSVKTDDKATTDDQRKVNVKVPGTPDDSDRTVTVSVTTTPASTDNDDSSKSSDNSTTAPDDVSSDVSTSDNADSPSSESSSDSTEESTTSASDNTESNSADSDSSKKRKRQYTRGQRSRKA